MLIIGEKNFERGVTKFRPNAYSNTEVLRALSARRDLEECTIEINEVICTDPQYLLDQLTWERPRDCYNPCRFTLNLSSGHQIAGIWEMGGDLYDDSKWIVSVTIPGKLHNGDEGYLQLITPLLNVNPYHIASFKNRPLQLEDNGACLEMY